MKKLLIITFTSLIVLVSARAQFRLPTAPAREPNAAPSSGRAGLDKQIAAQFAPVIYQGLGDQPRFDFITNFDFDGDWKGDNNWVNAGNKTTPLRAYVYYSVIETTTHYFVLYAFFHPRDYKGGLGKSTLVDALIREGVRRAGKDPTGLADDVALSHENDLEGCLVVAEKRGTEVRHAAVQYVETMAHNRYLKYFPREAKSAVGELMTMKEQRPLLFAEPKGHGVVRYLGNQEQLKKSIRGTLIYSYSGMADDPEKARGDAVGYDLLALYETLWPQAQTGENDTFGEALEYQPLTILTPRLDGTTASQEQPIGKLGAAFRGVIGFKNKARPPWGWYDDTEKDRPRGEWFFHPAAAITRHFNLDATFAQTYVYHPYLKIGVE
ncbi:MAG TPA: hypothetical protein VFZ34_21285 [Blastocatellia bacterium]|nr:hypothetical protein [Blastocatellia bacterium]